MGAWKKVNRCKECGKIYANGIPYICKKCGVEIGRPSPMLIQAMGGGPVTMTDKCEKVVAKKSLFGWKIRREVENADMSEV